MKSKFRTTARTAGPQRFSPSCQGFSSPSKLFILSSRFLAFPRQRLFNDTVTLTR